MKNIFKLICAGAFLFGSSLFLVNCKKNNDSSPGGGDGYSSSQKQSQGQRGSLTFFVRNAMNTGIPNAVIKIAQNQKDLVNGNHFEQLITNSDGFVRFNRLKTGTWFYHMDVNYFRVHVHREGMVQLRGITEPLVEIAVEGREGMQ